jgi:hypothetical protein
MTGSLQVEISPGELIDKITILQIKEERIDDSAKRANVKLELVTLMRSRNESLEKSTTLDELTTELKRVNESLWEIEDDIRICERDRDFSTKFVELARSVYRVNDERASLKRQINELLNSSLIEEKSYVDYAPQS